MIVEPINDTECLGQLTTFARELAPSTLIRTVAARLGTRETVIKWLQSLPQADDYGDEHVRFIQCDVPQRVRLLPDDPNCVERSTAALMLLEALDPKTPRALATVDKPLRHTGLVERYGGHWHAVDLFPRRNAQRNFDWGNFGKDVLQGVHNYAGKPILKFYLGESGGKVADTLGEQEDKLIDRDKKKQPEKKNPPPPAGPRGPVEQPKQAQPKPSPASPSPQAHAGRFSFASLVGAGANPGKTNEGGVHGEETKGQRDPSAARPVDAAPDPREAADGDGGHSHDEGAQTQRWWWSLGR